MTEQPDNLASQKPPEQQTQWAYERTLMASQRTLLAMIRTGLAVAGGGSVVAAILTREWPDWVVIALAGVFILAGFGLVSWGLWQHHKLLESLQAQSRFAPLAASLRLPAGLAALLLMAIIISVVLFILGTP